MRRLLQAVLLCTVLCVSASASIVSVRFWNSDGLVQVGRAVPADMAMPEGAVRALVAGPTQTEKDAGITSRIPAGTSIVSLSISDDTVSVDLSDQVLTDIDEDTVQCIFEQFKSTLGDFPSITTIKLTCGGKLLSSYLPPAPQVSSAPTNKITAAVTSGTGLSGKKICVGPSHGRYWNGSGWYWQRSLTCDLGEAVLEDTNSIRLVQFLKQYLVQDGATFICPRQLDESDCCNPDTGYPWWKMCAQVWLHHIGVSSSIWANSSGSTGADATSGVNRYSDDIRARPLYADNQGADIYIAHHTNAGGGTGTETYRDSEMEHPAYETSSLNLANDVHNSVISTIRNTYEGQSGWVSRGVKDSQGGFGEIRIPSRPAILIELGFHDDCSGDAPCLADDFFRSVAEWGIYNGICDYFGTTPTWDKYSDEYVSDTFPASMLAGQTRVASITMRNRGVSWFTSHGFRLGAVGGSDPFTSSNRVSIAGEVRPGDTYTFNITLTAPTTTGTYTSDWQMVRDGYTWFGPTVTKTINVIPNDDSVPPTTPTNIHVTGTTTSSISIAWDASTDNYGVNGYRVYRNGAQIGTTMDTTYTDTGLNSNTTYAYQVDAYDSVPLYSAKSAGVAGTTVAMIFQDGFADANNWTLDSAVSGNTAPTYSTAQNHGSISGDGSLYMAAGAAQWVYHDLSPSMSTGGYKTGMLNGWMYDTSAASGLRIALRAYLYDSTGSNKTMYWIGVTNGNPPNIATHYIGAVLNGSWTYYDLGSRTTGWHKLGIQILPYTGSDDLKWYIDDVNVLTTSQPSSAENAFVRKIYLGYNYNVNQDSYWDDITFESQAPAAPSNVTGTALSANSIRWSFTDNANNENGFRLYSGVTKLLEQETQNLAYIDETGLQPNTTYTRSIRAYEGTLQSLTASGTGSTLSTAPTTSTVTCDKTTGSWYTDGQFTFTAVGGFGAGTVHHYLTAWDNQATHTWTGSEAVWSIGTSVQTATANAEPWYFHVKGYNSASLENGTLDLGPYYFDNTPPSQPTVMHAGDTTGLTLTASWSASDNESGIDQYQYAVGTNPGGTDLLGWTTPSPKESTQFSRSDLTLLPDVTYYISVKACNKAQLWSEIGTSDGIKLSVPEYGIADAKNLPDGSDVRIRGSVVVGAFDGCFYIEETDRRSGIKVLSSATVTIGQIIDVTGRIQGAGAERYIAATSVQ